MFLNSGFRKLPSGWQQALGSLSQEGFFKKLDHYLTEEKSSGKQIYPEPQHIFRALQEVDLSEVKVVILGQDPYHGPGQAIGLSFAVPNSLKKKPPSLKNIFKEIESDLGVKLVPEESDLSGWVKQGVLLLNTALTVEAEKPLSHHKKGWEEFIHHVIGTLNSRKEPMIFILWGSNAQAFKTEINSKHHAIIESAHPSPLSAYRGFFGSKVFSKANQILKQWKQTPIHWEQISDPSSGK